MVIESMNARKMPATFIAASANTATSIAAFRFLRAPKSTRFVPISQTAFLKLKCPSPLSRRAKFPSKRSRPVQPQTHKVRVRPRQPPAHNSGADLTAKEFYADTTCKKLVVVGHSRFGGDSVRIDHLCLAGNHAGRTGALVRGLCPDRRDRKPGRGISRLEGA